MREEILCLLVYSEETVTGSYPQQVKQSSRPVSMTFAYYPPFYDSFSKSSSNFPSKRRLFAFSTFTGFPYTVFCQCNPANIVRVIKSRRMRWAGHVARMGEERGVYRVFLEKPERKRPLERPRRRWVDNIRMNLQEVECGYMDWIGLVQDRERWRTLVSVVMNLRVP